MVYYTIMKIYQHWTRLIDRLGDRVRIKHPLAPRSC